MAIFEDIQREAVRAQESGRIATEVFMSSLTQRHLAGELYKRVAVNYHNPKHITMRGKAKAVSPSEMENRLPTEITVNTRRGALRLRIRIRESEATDTFTVDFKKLVKQIDYRTGREEYVAQPERG